MRSELPFRKRCDKPMPFAAERLREMRGNRHERKHEPLTPPKRIRRRSCVRLHDDLGTGPSPLSAACKALSTASIRSWQTL